MSLIITKSGSQLYVQADDGQVNPSNAYLLIDEENGNISHASALTVDLGTDSARWNDFYTNGTSYLAGAPTGVANGSGDEAIIGSADGNVGITLYASSSGYGGIYFADETDNDRGLFRFYSLGERFDWLIAGSNLAYLDSNSFRPASDGGLDLGNDSTRHWGAGYFNDALYVAGAPGTGWNTSADDLVIGPGTGNVGISLFATGSTGLARIMVRDDDQSAAGLLQYNNAADSWSFWTNGVNRVFLDSSQMSPSTDGAISLGSNGNSWNDLYAQGSTISLAGLLYPSSDGISGSVITTDGGGNLTFTSEAIGLAHVEATEIAFGDESGNITSNSDLTFFTGSRNLRIGNTTDTTANITLITDQAGVGYIYFADDTSSTVGQIRYDHSVNNMFFTAGGVTHMRMGDNSLRPNAIGGTDLGASANWWGTIYAATGTFGETNSGDSEINLRSGGTSQGFINFVDGAGTDGAIQYNHSDRSMRFTAAGAQKVALFDTAFRTTSAATVDLGGNSSNTRFRNAYLSANIYVDDAPTSDWNFGADTIAVGSGTTSVGISFWPGGGGIYRHYVRSGSNAADGGFNYDPPNAIMTWRVGNSSEMQLSSTELRPFSDGGLNLGDSSTRFASGFFQSALYVADAPTGIANGNADDIVVGTNSDAGTGMTLFASSSGFSALMFGDENSSTAGQMRYVHNGNYFNFYVGDTSEMQLYSTQLAPTTNGGLDIGNNSNRWGDGYFNGTLYAAGAPTSTAAASYDDVVIGDQTGATGITLFATSSLFSGLIFADENDNDAGRFIYNHAGNYFQWAVNGSNELLLYNSDLRPQTDGGLSLGLSSNRFLAGYINTLYVAGASGGTANGAADDLIIGETTDTTRGMTILTTGSSTGYIMFGDDGNNNAGQFRYNHGASFPRFEWVVETALEMVLNEAQLYPETDGGLNLGGNANRWNQGYFADSLFVADAPTGTANANADDLIVANASGGSSGRGISIFASSSGYSAIFFGDENNATSGQVRYNHSDDSFTFYVATSGEMFLNNTSLRPLGDGGLLLGNDTFGWEGLYLSEQTAPSVSAGTGLVYVDSSDDHLKYRNSSISNQIRKLDIGVAFDSEPALTDATVTVLGWRTHAAAQYGTAQITGASPEDVSVVAPFDCVVYITLRGAASTDSNWGNTTARLYTNRSTSIVDSDTFNYGTSNSDLVNTFDLSSTIVNEGDLIHISFEPSSGAGPGIATMHLVAV